MDPRPTPSKNAIWRLTDGLEVITLEDPRSRDEKLNRAISTLIPAALERRQGILVIQRDYGKYTVRVDHEVPCGTTLESLNTSCEGESEEMTDWLRGHP